MDLFRRSRFDVMLFHVAHTEELDLPALASARFLETEGDGYFNAEPDAVRVLYRRRFESFLSEIKANCQARGTEWDPGENLRRPLWISAQLFPQPGEMK